ATARAGARCCARSRYGSSTASTCARGCTNSLAAPPPPQREDVDHHRRQCEEEPLAGVGEVVVGQVAGVGHRERLEPRRRRCRVKHAAQTDDPADPTAIPFELLRRPRPAERDFGLAAALDFAAGHLGDAGFARRAGGRGGADTKHPFAIELAPAEQYLLQAGRIARPRDRKSTRLNSSHVKISYAVLC